MNDIHRKVLKHLWKFDKTTTKEISKNLRIDVSTASRILKDLLQKGFIVVSGERRSGSYGGRKSRLYSLVAVKYLILGLGFGRSELVLSVANLRGEFLEERRWANDVSDVIHSIKRAVENLDYFENLFGVAIAIPGMVDGKSGRIIRSEILNLKDFDLMEKLEDCFPNVNFLLLSDAESANMSYHHELQDVVYFLVNTSRDFNEPVRMRAGIRLNGRIRAGSNSSAGEFRADILPPVLNDSDHHHPEDLRSVDVESVIDFIERLLDIVEISVYLIDPQAVVIGGDINLLSPEIHEFLRDTLKKRLHNTTVGSVEIVIDTAGLRAVARGAAMVFLKRFMNDPNFFQSVLAKKDLL